LNIRARNHVRVRREGAPNRSRGGCAPPIKTGTLREIQTAAATARNHPADDGIDFRAKIFSEHQFVKAKREISNRRKCKRKRSAVELETAEMVKESKN
jgi:hypothetical protein